MGVADNPVCHPDCGLAMYAKGHWHVLRDGAWHDWHENGCPACGRDLPDLDADHESLHATRTGGD